LNKLEITADKLKQILGNQGINKEDQEEIIEKLDKNELDNIIKEVKHKKNNEKEIKEKDQKTVNLARKLGYKKGVEINGNNSTKE